MRIRTACLCLLSMLLAAPVGAAQDWKLIKEDKRRGINVYLRKDNYRVCTNKLESTADAGVPSLLAVILDIDNMTHWVWRLREAKVLEQKSATEMYLHLVFDSPGGVEDRDAVVRLEVQQDPVTHAVNVSSRLVPDYLPEQPPLVRMAALEMNWSFQTADDGRTQVQMTGVIDPGGKMPEWTLNMIGRDALYTSFKNLLKRGGEKEYARAELPFKGQ